MTPARMAGEASRGWRSRPCGKHRDERAAVLDSSASTSQWKRPRAPPGGIFRETGPGAVFLKLGDGYAQLQPWVQIIDDRVSEGDRPPGTACLHPAHCRFTVAFAQPTAHSRTPLSRAMRLRAVASQRGYENGRVRHDPQPIAPKNPVISLVSRPIHRSKRVPLNPDARSFTRPTS